MNKTKDSISKISQRSYDSNKKRNLFIIVALILTTFMMTSVFSIGISYIETYKLQQIRYMGTTANIVITNPTENQIHKLKERTDIVSVIGVSQRLGSVDTSDLDDTLLGLVWIDQEEWIKHRMPTIEGIVGKYPMEEDEVMLPTWVLEKMGIQNPEIGMSIPISYKLEKNENFTKTKFKLSGYYTDYIVMRSNGVGYSYVSKKFQEKTSADLNYGKSTSLSFKNADDIEKQCTKLKLSVEFSNEQVFDIVPIYTQGNSTIVFALIVIIAFIMVCAYLLIYNILYLSVSKDIIFYGQLKTIGATNKQIKKIMWKQIWRFATLGIPTGVLMGYIFSYKLIPIVLQIMYAGNLDVGIKASFSPIICIGTVVFALFILFLGCAKPIKIASKISPMEALRYIPKSYKVKSKIKKKTDVSLKSIAWKNILRRKKSASLVLASLSIGVLLFIIMIGISDALSPERFVEQWGDSDFIITYDIQTKEEPITKELIDKIEEIQGIDNIHLTYVLSPDSSVNVKYDENTYGKYVRSLGDNPNIKRSMDFSDSEVVKRYTENFFGYIYGIDENYIKNSIVDGQVNLEEFNNGDIVLFTQVLDSNGDNVFIPGTMVNISQSSSGENSFIVGNGFLNSDFQSGRGKTRGSAPDMYISSKVLLSLFNDSKVYRIEFNSKNDKDDEIILKQLELLTSSNSDLNIISRYQKLLEMKDYVITVKTLSLGLSFVLFFIGIMNFVNTMFVSINERSWEFILMKKIGTTKKQITEILIYEGMYYWLGTVIVVLFGGGLLLKVLSILLKDLVPYANISYPLISALIVSFISLIICIGIPILLYENETKKF